MKALFKKNMKWQNFMFLVIVLLLILPQTRYFIQLNVHKVFAKFSPSIIDKKKRNVIVDEQTLHLKSIKGEFFDLKLKSNKIILINFWATWCPPCVAEMPSLQKLHENYKHEVEFVFISGEKPSIIQAFLSKHKYAFEVYNNVGQLPDFLVTKSIPRTILIDKTGEIIIDKIGAADWNGEAVRHTLDNLIK